MSNIAVARFALVVGVCCIASAVARVAEGGTQELDALNAVTLLLGALCIYMYFTKPPE